MSKKESPKAVESPVERDTRPLFETPLLQLALSAAIVASFLPATQGLAGVQLVAVVLLAADLFGRLRAVQSRRGRRGFWFFFALDLLALLSFLPIAPAGLQLVRLVRLVPLFRSSRDWLVDLLAALRRPEVTRQLAFVASLVATLAVAATVVLHETHSTDRLQEATGSDDYLDHIWWAFRQLESPDNLVADLQGPWVLTLISIGLTSIGVLLFAYVIGIGATVVEQVWRSEKLRPVPFSGHTIVIAQRQISRQLVTDFVRMHQKNADERSPLQQALRYLSGKSATFYRRRSPHLVVLDEQESAPEFFSQLRMRKVLHRRGRGWDTNALERASVESASRILVADALGADENVLATLVAIHGLAPGAIITAEIRTPTNTDLARALGNGETTIVDLSRFNALVLTHIVQRPALAAVFHELLSPEGKELYSLLADDELSTGDTLNSSMLAAFAEQGVLPLLGFAERARRNDRGTFRMSEIRPESLSLGCSFEGGWLAIADSFPHLATCKPKPVKRGEGNQAMPPLQLITKRKAHSFVFFGEDLSIDLVLERLHIANRDFVVQRYDKPTAGALAAAAAEADVVMFFSSAERESADQQTTLQALQFCEALGRLVLSDPSSRRQVRVLVELEVLSSEKSFREQCSILSRGAVKLSVLQSRLWSNFFLVQSAFVPGLTQGYTHLLEHAQFEELELELTDSVPFSEVVYRCAEQHFLALAAQDQDDQVRVLPRSLSPGSYRVLALRM